ncbi:Uncharacterised protein [Bordetella pertussis]|nr:Uncharacterised protein [Bordetella pertussis]
MPWRASAWATKPLTNARLGQAHRLPDHHEASRQQPHAAHAPRVGLQLLLDAGSHVQPPGQEGVDHRLRAGRAHDLGMLQGARQVQVIGAALAHGDALAGSVDVFVSLQRGVVAHQIGPFDQYIGAGEGNARAARRIDGEKPDIGFFPGDGVDRLPGGVEHPQFDASVQAPGEFPRQVDRHADGLAGRIGAGQDGVAQVDGGAQLAGRQESRAQFGVDHHGGARRTGPRRQGAAGLRSNAYSIYSGACPVRGLPPANFSGVPAPAGIHVPVPAGTGTPAPRAPRSTPRHPPVRPRPPADAGR